MNERDRNSVWMNEKFLMIVIILIMMIQIKEWCRMETERNNSKIIHFIYILLSHSTIFVSYLVRMTVVADERERETEGHRQKRKKISSEANDAANPYIYDQYIKDKI